MSARSKARKRALDVLFAADVRGETQEQALEAEALRAAARPERASSWPYARDIVQGVIDHADEIDALISDHSTSWPLDRMPAVDRGILRIAVWESRYNPEVPIGVAIDEAVELAKELSTDDSPKFVNGLLTAITKDADRALQQD
ncbi:transcription antitermination factor NusB [uncultured Amnibacterium sp.]|uniref:transcription antitermination factor NusB n=1 Tax=uncultured Amnibacterium sp. TaxID=1631851 RepID=UPI0035C979E0